jgi:hypothetical protein
MTELLKISLPYIVLGGVAIFIVGEVFREIDQGKTPIEDKHSREIGESCGEDVQCKDSFGPLSLVGCCSGKCAVKNNILGVPVCPEKDKNTIDYLGKCSTNAQCKGDNICCSDGVQSKYCVSGDILGFCKSTSEVMRQVTKKEINDMEKENMKPCQNRCKPDELCIDDVCQKAEQQDLYDCPEGWIYSRKYGKCVDTTVNPDREHCRGANSINGKCPPGWICVDGDCRKPEEEDRTCLKGWLYSDKYNVCLDPLGPPDKLCGPIGNRKHCYPGWQCINNKCEIPVDRVKVDEYRPYDGSHMIEAI